MKGSFLFIRFIYQHTGVFLQRLVKGLKPGAGIRQKGEIKNPSFRQTFLNLPPKNLFFLKNAPGVPENIFLGTIPQNKNAFPGTRTTGAANTIMYWNACERWVSLEIKKAFNVYRYEQFPVPVPLFLRAGIHSIRKKIE